jgi:adenine deaminase
MIEILGQFVDIEKKEIYPAKLIIEAGTLKEIQKIDQAPAQFILPGFIDAHIHIESSMLVPSEFAKIAVKHGTVATVSDPHEIANVLGIEGVRYMIENSKKADFKFFFGVPSCVPATAFETAGASLNPEEIEELFEQENLLYLSEMMNYPGVIFEDEMVLSKIAIAQKFGCPIDGHAPGLRGSDLEKYVSAGISTDHECFGLEEALEKISLGMKIIIREGSAAKNFAALHSLLASHPERVMLCTDDKHPDELLEGHINLLVRRAVSMGYDLFDVLKSACLNPIEHYKLPVGRLRPGEPADFIVVQNLEDFEVLQTFIAGNKVFDFGHSTIYSEANIQTPNRFFVSPKTPQDFNFVPSYHEAIVALDGEIVTDRISFSQTPLAQNPDDLLKIAVVCRYKEKAPACAWIKGFGLKNAAIASCVAHDSHNIVVVGDSDELICKAVNLIIEAKGGISLAAADTELILALPVGGIMSDKDAAFVGKEYQKLDLAAKRYGCRLKAPFMTLSFMALPVIPKLKLSDFGLFDVERFEFAKA